MFRKKPKGYRNFTDFRAQKGLEKEGYETKVGRDPYTKSGKKVVFYRPKRSKTKSSVSIDNTGFSGMGMGFGAPPRKNDRRRPPSLFDGL